MNNTIDQEALDKLIEAIRADFAWKLANTEITIDELRDSITAKTDYDDYLTILAEECSEVAIEISKIKRFGPESHHPDEIDVTNKDRLEREIGDFEAMVEFLKRSSLDLNGARIAVAKSKKMDKIRKIMWEKKKAGK